MFGGGDEWYEPGEADGLALALLLAWYYAGIGGGNICNISICILDIHIYVHATRHESDGSEFRGCRCNAPSAGPMAHNEACRVRRSRHPAGLSQNITPHLWWSDQRLSGRPRPGHTPHCFCTALLRLLGLLRRPFEFLGLSSSYSRLRVCPYRSRFCTRTAPGLVSLNATRCPPGLQYLPATSAKPLCLVLLTVLNLSSFPAPSCCYHHHHHHHPRLPTWTVFPLYPPYTTPITACFWTKVIGVPALISSPRSRS